MKIYQVFGQCSVLGLLLIVLALLLFSAPQRYMWPLFWWENNFGDTYRLFTCAYLSLQIDRHHSA